MQMARREPLDEEALLAISGVGQSKRELYGWEFLAAIARCCIGESAVPERTMPGE